MRTGQAAEDVVEPGATRPELSWLVAALVVAAFLASFGALHFGFFTRNPLMDTPIYERYGDAIVHGGKVPYRDFGVEYPPAALPVFAAPSLVANAGDFPRYARAFEVLMLVCGAAAAALVGRMLIAQGAGAGRLAAGTLLAGLSPLALGPVVLSRFDLWPAMLTIGALAALLADRRRTAFAVLGTAIAAKLYPAVLLPPALAFVYRRSGPRAAARSAAVVIAVVAAWFLPFVLLAPHGVWASLSGQATRPLQIESLGGSVLLAAHQVWSLPLTEISSHGSDNLVGRLPHLLALAEAILAPAAIVAIWVAFARGPADRSRLLRYTAASLCAFVVLGKVLSPQYLIWLIPVVPLVRGRRGSAAAALFVAAMVLTQLWFPYRYIRLVYELDARASWLVFARDALLVALLLTLLWSRRFFRPGRAVVAVLVLASAAAVGAAFASHGASAPMHSGLLDETGVASSCARQKPPPRVSGGRVAYDASLFANLSRRTRCVTVMVSTERRVQAFSAAYLQSFEETDPRAHYLGDAGSCTNIPAATGSSRQYGFEVPAHTSFVVEVESCSSEQGTIPYRITVSAGGAPPPIDSAAAKRSRGAVVLRLRTQGARSVRAFDVYRQTRGVRILVGRLSPRGSEHRAVFTDRAAPLDSSLRYWLRARRTNGSWSWYGPIAVR